MTSDEWATQKRGFHLYRLRVHTPLRVQWEDGSLQLTG